MLQKKIFFIKQFYKIFQALLCLQSIKHILQGKVKFLKQATDIRYVIAKLLKFVQIDMQTALDSFLQRIFLKLYRASN